MLTRHFKYCLVGCLLFWLGSCVEPYKPSVLVLARNYLVADGFINSQGPTTIRLSRTLDLDGNSIPPGETKARVWIEEENGPQFMLREGQNGTYTSDALQLNPTRRYRLRIRTIAGSEYASAFTQNKITPPIDKISWKAADDNLQLYVSTHDPQQNTHYYAWKFEETWEYTTPFYSSFEYRNNRVVDRRDDINRCWRGNNSSAILIGSSAKLTQDVISEFPLITLLANSAKLKYKYSMLVKQYAQTKEAYEYAQALKKNTENIGTLFDPLPTQLTGNIQCITNPAEPVIGFISVGSVQEKRIFISRSQLPAHWRTLDEYGGCIQDTVLSKDIAVAFAGNNQIPTIEAHGEAGEFIGYMASSADCVDCRVRGTNVKPAFWE